MVEKEIIDDLVEDITSWSNFYIIADEESVSLAREFHSMLEMQNISSFVIFEGMEDSFKRDLDEDDSVLLISRRGRDDFVRAMVKVALKKRVRTYAVCSDFRSPLAMLCEETIVIRETDDFKEEALRIFNRICENLSNDQGKDTYEIQDPVPAYIAYSNVTSAMSGVIVEIKVDVGDVVKEGDVLFVIDAMKMENEIASDMDGVVEEIMVEPGDFVKVGDSIIEIR